MEFLETIRRWQRWILKKPNVKVLESSIEIREDDEVFTVEIMRNKDGTIWGVYSEKPNNDTCVFADGVRNILILFQMGILQLKDFPRQKRARGPE